MSHTATVKSTKIVSITALRSAITELAATGIRCSLIENTKPRAFYPDQPGMGLAPFVLKLDQSPYDIGLYKTEDGSYEARTDWYGGHIDKILGAQATSAESRDQARMGKLFQMYAVHAATEAARKKGHMVRRVAQADGRITLEVTGPNL